MSRNTNSQAFAYDQVQHHGLALLKNQAQQDLCNINSQHRNMHMHSLYLGYSANLEFERQYDRYFQNQLSQLEAEEEEHATELLCWHIQVVTRRILPKEVFVKIIDMLYPKPQKPYVQDSSGQQLYLGKDAKEQGHPDGIDPRVVDGGIWEGFRFPGER
ncbi:hypothetical protein MMC21_005479 [Puttea exsequens]|nr:hypothetical protein [Puttea exsequens]